MRCVMLQAHPQSTGCLNVALLHRLAGILKASGHDVEVVRIAQGESISALDVAGAESLILVYPTWWGGLPAPLLGWFQRELLDWIDGPADAATSPLRTVRHLVAVTTHGSPRRVNWLQGQPGLQLLKRTVARLCAPGTRLRWLALYGLDQSSAERVAAFIDSTVAELSQL
ncbi:MAG: NAD(P)H-dependent oxidoreductase [Acidimicrobiaceae bacterium]|nr:NAD(P)H-dependent oxidoreductase [Acidimicrobiaceae bacterium]